MNKIAIGIVAYGEPYYESLAYKSVLNSLSLLKTPLKYKLYVYDNTDSPNWKINGSNKQESIWYFHDKQNSGISIAYNQIAKQAIKDGMQWIILLDQDTDLPKGAMYEYNESIERNSKISVKVPILYVHNKIFSPLKMIFQRSLALKSITPGIYLLSKLKFVNSGMMVSLSTFTMVGGYNENIKLDFADFQFIQRMIQKKVNEFEVLPVKCIQNFSHEEKNLTKAITRYKIYLLDLKNCDKNGLVDTMAYKLNGLLHTLKLTLIHRSLKFLKIRFLSS